MNTQKSTMRLFWLSLLIPLIIGIFSALITNTVHIIELERDITKQKDTLAQELIKPSSSADTIRFNLVITIAQRDTVINRVIITAILGILLGLIVNIAYIRRDIENVLKGTMSLEQSKHEIAKNVGVYGDFFRMSFIRDQIYAIIKSGNPKSLGLDKLSERHRRSVESWVSEVFTHFQHRAKDFSSRQTYFDGETGMLIDYKLISDAEKLIYASTKVTPASIEFWTNTSHGSSYRIANSTSVDRIYQSEPRNSHQDINTWGVYRVFTLDERDIQEQCPPNIDNDILEKVLQEAHIQEELGIKVRITSSDGISDDIEDLDILIIDKQLSSVTEQMHRNGASRRIKVSWYPPENKDYINKWKILWAKSMSLSDFCHYHSLKMPDKAPQNYKTVTKPKNNDNS